MRVNVAFVPCVGAAEIYTVAASSTTLGPTNPYVGDVIFTAVPVSTKLAARKQPTNYKLKLSKGVEIKNFLSADADLDLDPNFCAIVDALQPACHPYSCKVSQDLVLFLRGV